MKEGSFAAKLYQTAITADERQLASLKSEAQKQCEETAKVGRFDVKLGLWSVPPGDIPEIYKRFSREIAEEWGVEVQMKRVGYNFQYLEARVSWG